MTTAKTDTSPDPLSNHIEAFQERLRKLPRTASLKDIGAQLVAAVNELYPGLSVEVAHCPGDLQGWVNIVRAGSSAGEQSAIPDVGKTPPAFQVYESRNGIAIVQKLIDKSFIGLAISGDQSHGNHSAADVLALRLFLHLFDGAYQDMMYRRNEKGLVFSLNHRILQLNSLIDTGIEVASLDSNSSPHRLALERAASLTNASKGVVRVMRGDLVQEEYTFPDGVPAKSSTGREGSIQTQFKFSHDIYAFQLFEKESRSGIVPFDETDQLLLDALARQVHASLENRYLLQQALEKQRIDQEIKVAASIQQKIIPMSLPKIPGYDISGKNIPSKSVGGDYYDCVRLRDGRYALIIADVTGKGVPAALLVSSLHAYLTAYFELSVSLSEIMGKLNTALYNASTDDKFVTAFIALLSPETGEIECSNAGHNVGYVLKNDDTVQELKVGGFPLAAFDLGRQYKSEKFTLEKGERLFLYTDGVTEATNEKDEFYEHHVQLPVYVARNKPGRAESFIVDLIADVKKFTGSAPQNDDITALYLSRNL